MAHRYLKQLRSQLRKLYFNFCIYTANLLSVVAGIIITWNLRCNNDEYNNKSTKTWIYTILTLSATPMPVIFTYISQKYGRKLSLLMITLPLLAADVILAISTCQKPPKTYLLARALAGFALGASMSILHIYIHEICISANKPQYFHSHRVFVSFGIFINYTISTTTTETKTTPYRYSASGAPFVNLVSISILTAFLVLLICFMPETPQYLIAKKKEMRAKDVLIKLKNSTMIDGEFRLLCERMGTNNEVMRPWTNQNWRILLMSTMLMCVFREFSMAHVIYFYARDIFVYLNAINSNASSSWQPVSVGVQLLFLGLTQFIATAIVLHFIGKFNRKTVVIACLIILCTIALFPMACYFKLVNKDAKIIVINARNTLGEVKKLSGLTRNAKWTSWLPVICFAVIFAMHNALGAIFDMFVWESYVFSPDVRQWAVAICKSWSWLCWSVCNIMYVSMEDSIGIYAKMYNDEDAENVIWIWFSFSFFVCVFGIIITVAYLPIDKNLK